jgi:hypothetical protein
MSALICKELAGFGCHAFGGLQNQRVDVDRESMLLLHNSHAFAVILQMFSLLEITRESMAPNWS